MQTKRGKVVAVCSAVLSIAVLAMIGFVFRDPIIKEWRLSSSRSIVGTVNFTGTPPPKPAPILLTDANCAAMHKTSPLFPEDVILNDNRTLKNVLVYASAGLEGKTFPAPNQPVVLDQRGCQFVPHVFGIQISQKLEILNSDNTNHNVHALPRVNREFNVGMPVKGMRITKDFARAEMPFIIRCEVHPWMKAWCGVFGHPFFSVTNDQGEYQIANLPPGRYTLTAWHEKYGEKKQEIQVSVWGSQTVTFNYNGV